MKHLIAVFLVFICVAAFSLEYTNGNNSLRFTWEGDGVVRVFLPDAQEPLLEIVPALKGKVTAEITPRNWMKYKILSLRSAESSLGIRMDDSRPSFTISVNRNASPVEIRWNAQAVVLPDLLAEDTILETDFQEHALPAFLPAYVGLIQGENAVVTVVPYQAHQDAVLSADLRTLTLSQQNTEDYCFLVNAGQGVWHQALLPENVGDSYTDESWSRPYPALWKGSIAMEQDFLPSGDGSRVSWGVANFRTRDDGKTEAADLSQRCCMTNTTSRQTWLGGFEGNFRYPLEFQDGHAQLHNVLFQVRDRARNSTSKPVYFYAIQRSNQSPKDLVLPWDVIPCWNQKYLFSSNTLGSTPATCTVTENIERLFYNDQAAEQAESIHQQLLSMQFFVEGIRGRIENARVWKAELLEFADRECRAEASLETQREKLAAILQDVDDLYNAALPVIQTPDVVEGLCQKLYAVAKSDDDPEVMEDAAKDICRQIRTIGGGQDNLNAKMRHIGKNLRYQALQNYMTAQEPAVRAFWTNIYQKTDSLLQGYFGHDGK